MALCSRHCAIPPSSGAPMGYRNVRWALVQSVQPAYVLGNRARVTMSRSCNVSYQRLGDTRRGSIIVYVCCVHVELTGKIMDNDNISPGARKIREASWLS